ncbi:hypothetical protein JK386_10105 [Nocardioides sp. zg-536]|uniref:Uncharacterized protein n=1 Tax=Nocardioides faecalis TaxID=2803858 RepID=A0A939BVR9_9ACTN|nr:hypothetical protein [Nocardioides faecalis]MBM9460256.1 hypothetical protein [Nocardioides faecalis]QVI59958.1 hypothetical protein KG111_06500 [Nocardioides faecalis]
MVGETFLVAPDGRGGTSYTWLTGPNDGYSFGSSPAAETVEQHGEHIRDFLAMIDPQTGYVGG